MVKEAAIVAVAIVIAGFFMSGRYQAVAGDSFSSILRLDRWTGEVCNFQRCRSLGEE